MADAPPKQLDNSVIKVRKSIKSIQNFISSLTEPIDESDYIKKYGSLSFNIKNGIFSYKDYKSIPLKQNRPPFTIISILFENPGAEVSHSHFATKLGLLYDTKINKKLTRTLVRSTLKNIRRRWRINAAKNPETNIFVMSGDGIK